MDGNMDEPIVGYRDLVMPPYWIIFQLWQRRLECNFQSLIWLEQEVNVIRPFLSSIDQRLETMSKSTRSHFDLRGDACQSHSYFWWILRHPLDVADDADADVEDEE